MSLYALRRRTAMARKQNPALPRRMITGLLAIILVMGYLVQTDREFPRLLIAIMSLFGAMVVFSMGLRKPEIPLYALVAYLPFSKLLAGDFGGIMMALNLTNILIVIVLVCYTSNAATEGQLKFESHLLHGPVFLMVLWGIIALAVACAQHPGVYPARAIPEFKRWLDPFLVYFLVFHVVHTPQRWKGVVAVLMIGVTIVALMATHDYMTVREGTSLEKARIGGIADQPNILGAFFVYYMYIFAAFWLERMKQPRAWLWLIPFGLCFRGIMVTFSRGAYLAFAQGLMGLAFFKHKMLFLLACGALLFAVLNPSVLPEGIRYRIMTTFHGDQTQLADAYSQGNPEQELDKSAGMRVIIWRSAGQMIQEHPWFGVGLTRFPIKIQEYMPAAYSKYIDAHNAYIITAAEMGIPACVIFLLTILTLFYVTSVVRTHHPDAFIRTTALGFLGGLSGLLMANMFGSRLNSIEVSGYFWILAALMARAFLWAREERAKKRRAPRQRFAPSPIRSATA